MLIPKKANKIKVAAYILIIMAMLGGTAFMIRQNYDLLTHSGAPIPISDLPSPEGNYGNPAASSASTTQPLSVGTASSSEEIIKAKLNNIFYLGLFDLARFKGLQDNSRKAQKIGIGKADPFQPEPSPDKK